MELNSKELNSLSLPTYINSLKFLISKRNLAETKLKVKTKECVQHVSRIYDIKLEPKQR